ncbi:putative permease, DMT superfamily [Shewanella psychrophila]|uniref:Putative permease, DMT superfamily n=1 Tax=Shewanella psychrophila TaxID=225848 RepID=A0A1S6HXE8_9GAMM|nr:DMT family transporter [Shewanella psychrophila]AQS40162.1 putative permease, DMT superfamily [Shewanella psychrophila]
MNQTASNKQSGLLELHLAVLLFGGTALFSKLIPLGALDITLLRCVVAAFVLAFIVKASKKKLSLDSPRDYFIALGLGIIVSLHWVTYFASMQFSSVAIGMIAFFTYPVMTVLIEPIFTGNRIQRGDIISGCTVLLGVILLIPEANLGNDITMGIALGILSAAFFTARNLLHKKYFSAYSGPHAMFYQTGVAVFFLAPWHTIAFSQIELNTWWLDLLLGVMFTAAPHALFTAALRHLSAKTVSLVSCLQPFYGAVLALLFLGEQLDIKTTMGGLLVVATAIFETQQNRKITK